MAACRTASLLDFGAAPSPEAGSVHPVAVCDEEEGLEEGILPAEGVGEGVAMDAEPGPGEMGDKGASAGEVGEGLGNSASFPC